MGLVRENARRSKTDVKMPPFGIVVGEFFDQSNRMVKRGQTEKQEPIQLIDKGLYDRIRCYMLCICMAEDWEDTLLSTVWIRKSSLCSSVSVP